MLLSGKSKVHSLKCVQVVFTREIRQNQSDDMISKHCNASFGKSNEMGFNIPCNGEGMDGEDLHNKTVICIHF